MSLLSKLLGGKKPTLSDVVDLLQGKESKPAAVKPTYSAPRPAEQSAPSWVEPTPIGRSWGEAMPDEPNQFNYNGTYHEYFEEIFRQEFSAYTFRKEYNRQSDKITSYTFFDGARKALVIELMGQSCDAYRLRCLCEREGVPYLRFYYNHDGWWNARSYVVNRMRKALGC